MPAAGRPAQLAAGRAAPPADRGPVEPAGPRPAAADRPHRTRSHAAHDRARTAAGGCSPPAAARWRRWPCSSCWPPTACGATSRPNATGCARRGRGRASCCSSPWPRPAWLAAVSMAAGAALGAGRRRGTRRRTPACRSARVLSHSLLTPAAAAGLAGGWVVAVALIAAVLLLPGGRLIDALALAAAAALALALTVGGRGGDTDAGAPGRAAGLPGGGGARLPGGAAACCAPASDAARRGPLVLRLALVGLARARTAPALAVAFVAVSTGLAGFALAYRATLARGAADEAAQQVPLDARVAPVARASPRPWRSPACSAGGRSAAAAPCCRSAGPTSRSPRRRDGLADRARRAGGGADPHPRLARRRRIGAPGHPGVPADAPRRRARPGAARSRRAPASCPSERRPPTARSRLSAELRGRSGAVTQVPLGDAGQRARTLHGRVPDAALRDGADELEALRARRADRGRDPQRPSERGEPRGRHPGEHHGAARPGPRR